MKLNTKKKAPINQAQNGSETVHVGTAVSKGLLSAIEEWAALNDSDKSKFARAAFREKLERDQIKIREN